MSSDRQSAHSDRSAERRRALATQTRPPSETTGGDLDVRFLRLMIVWHADLERVGESAWLPALDIDECALLSRHQPDFSRTDGDSLGGPLAEPTISRQPIRIRQAKDGLWLLRDSTKQRVTVAGAAMKEEVFLPESTVRRGVLLALGGRVLLSLRRQVPTNQSPPAFGLVGESPEMMELRWSIQTASQVSVPVLIRGESGTGKELVASAIQANGGRQTRAFHTINMAAIPPSLAASELFGAAKGAFSSADRERKGYFARSDHGTLFLDEIGETPREVQGLLLRVLENGEIQTLGAGTSTKVDVRIIAATDADLEQLVDDGAFSRALLHRLGGVEMRLPPLKNRREDFGPLFLHFLRQELAEVGRLDVLNYAGPFSKPFVSARLINRMVQHSWPGNVRELRNEVRQLVVASLTSEHLLPGRWQDADGAAESPDRKDERESPHSSAEKASSQRTEPTVYRDPSDPSDQELQDTLRKHDWNIKASAAALGLSRASLYGRIRSSPEIRQASDLDDDEIEAAMTQCGHRLAEAARLLQVSKHGLRRRLKDRKPTKEKP